jgi:ABC-type amino acid transport substrate-binding protein
MPYSPFRYLAARLWRLGLAVCVSCTGVCTAETLVVLGDDAYAPVIHMRGGAPSGFLVTILERASALTGDRYDVRLSPWKRAYELASRGEGGVVGVSFNHERAKLFDFSRPIYDDDIQIVTLANKSFPYARLEDLKGKTIGGVLGASYGDSVDNALASGLFAVERDVSQAGRLRKLLAGRLDAAFIGNGMAGFEGVINSQDDLRASRAQFTVLPTPLTRDPLHLAFAKSMNKREALDRFDAALDTLRKSGELKRLAPGGPVAK